MVLRFQWMDIEQDLTIYDKDKETLLDLILDWEANCINAGKEMSLQPRFYYMHNNEVQWLDLGGNFSSICFTHQPSSSITGQIFFLHPAKKETSFTFVIQPQWVSTRIRNPNF